jgi:hypothetical protein
MICRDLRPFNRPTTMRQRKNHKSIFQIGWLVGLLFACSALTVYSQTVTLQLNNGDRISGSVISEDLNRVILSNAWAKEIVIPLVEIKSREKIAATPTETNAVVAKVVPAPKPVVPVPPPAPPVKPKAANDWHGDIQVGADLALSERDRELYYAKFKITYAPVEEGTPVGASKIIGRFRNIFDYNAAYGTTEVEKNGSKQNVLSANRMDGSSKTDFDLGAERKTFVYNLMGAGYDEIRKIEYRYEFGPGIGYHLFNRTNLVLNSEVGMNYQVQHFTNGFTTDRFYYRFAEDFTWKISKKLTFDEKFELFPQVDFSEYRFRFECNLRYWLWENLSFNLNILDTYDTQTAKDVGRNDLQIRSSIGVKF